MIRKQVTMDLAGSVSTKFVVAHFKGGKGFRIYAVEGHEAAHDRRDQLISTGAWAQVDVGGKDAYFGACIPL